MNIRPRKSRQIVDMFLRSDSNRQFETLRDIATDLKRKHHGGSIDLMVCHLQKALRGNRLFEYRENGRTFYETKESRRRRLQLPKKAPKSMYINGNASEAALA